MREFRVSWKRLKGSEYASLMTRLAMVVNDISTAGVLLNLTIRQEEEPSLKNSDPELRKILGDFQLSKGFQLYAFRMMVGHFCEGMKIIELIRNEEEAGNKELCRHLARLGPETAKDYAFLKSMWVKGSTDKEDFQDIVQKIRHALAFHYEYKDEHIKKTITSMADADVRSSISFMDGTEKFSSRFCVADTVTFHAIVYSIWGVISKDEEETNAKINKNLKWCFEQCERLYTVGFNLCAMYFSEKSV